MFCFLQYTKFQAQQTAKAVKKTWLIRYFEKNPRRATLYAMGFTFTCIYGQFLYYTLVKPIVYVAKDFSEVIFPPADPVTVTRKE